MPGTWMAIRFMASGGGWAGWSMVSLSLLPKNSASEPNFKTSVTTTQADYRDPERYTEAQRSQHLGQSDTRVFGASYVARCSRVAGMEAFLDEPADYRHVDYFQSLEQFREPRLPCRLPARNEAALKSDPDLVALEYRMRALEQAKGDRSALGNVRKERNNRYQALYRKSLRKFQEQ